MSTVSLQELQRDPGALLDRVEAGEHLIVVRGGRPVAELRPVSATQPGPRPFGLCVGALTVPDGFDASLPEEILRGFEEESESVRAYDAAKVSGEQAIPFELAIEEIESQRK